MNYRNRNAHYLNEASAPEAPAAASAPSTPATKPAKAKKAAKPKAKPAKAKKKPGKSGAVKGVKGPAVLKQYAPNYVKGGKDGKAKTVSGNKTIDNGDKLADKLRGEDLDAVYALAAKTLNTALEEGEKQHTVGTLKAKYGKLNVGMQRMNLGNRMRAILYPKK